MSVRTSSEIRLALGRVGSPAIALLNQQAIYASNMWACGHGLHGVLHVIPAVCVLITLALALDSFVIWRAGNRQDGVVTERVRFIALVGVAISLFSSAVIIAQWAGVFVFDSCMRA